MIIWNSCRRLDSVICNSRIFSPAKLGIIRFQGHYLNRHEDIKELCNPYQQKRFFLSYTQARRKREYCGRQLVGFTMEQMYTVVSDVENYHKFVPWCKKSEVTQRSPDHLHASLVVGFPPINESYVSSVSLVKPHLVRAECTDGKLFHHMLTLWRFSPGLKREQQSCVVDFHITFQFRSLFHSQLSNLFFDQVAKKMEGAFILEVGRRYGKATMEPVNLLTNKSMKS